MNIISDHIANVISVYTKELNKKNVVYISEPRHERKKDYVPISHAMLPMPLELDVRADLKLTLTRLCGAISSTKPLMGA